MIKVTLDNNQDRFKPGDLVTGHVSWEVSSTDQKEISVALCWQTSGKGRAVCKVVEEQKFEVTQSGNKDFRFTLPKSPYSFSGQLITLLWQVVAETEDDDLDEVSFVMSPSAAEIILTPLPNEGAQLVTGSLK